MINPTHNDLNTILTEAVYDRIEHELHRSKPGHCLRISVLPEVVMRDLCRQLNRNGLDADVVLLLGPHQQGEQPWQVTATRLIELRNNEERPLLAFIPPGLKAAAEDSFDVSTFVEINLGNIPANLRRQLRQEVPEELQSSTDRIVRYLEKVERVITDNDIVRYYATILKNDASAEATGGALYQLGLFPDFALLQIDNQIEQRLDRNLDAVRTLTESNHPLLGRIHSLKLKPDTLQAPLYRFLREQPLTEISAWSAKIATDSELRSLAFDCWEFEGEDTTRDSLLLYLNDPSLSARDDDQPVGPDNPLYLDVNKATSVRIRWETNPKPSTVPDLAYYRVELVSADEGAVAWESKNIKNTRSARAYRTKSLKVKEFREQVEDGLYFLRMRAYTEAGQILNEEDAEVHPEILRDSNNPEGKRINETSDIWFWIDEDFPPPVEPQRNVKVNSFLEAQLLTQFAALDRGEDPFGDQLSPRTDKTGWVTGKGKRAEAIYNIVYDAQARYTLPVSSLLRQIESQTLAFPDNLGRWRLHFQEGQTYQDVQPTLRQFRPSVYIPETFKQTRQKLFEAIRAGELENLTATVDLPAHRDLILNYVQAYQDWLTEVESNFEQLAIREDELGRRRTDPVFLDLDIVELLLPGTPGADPTPDRVYLVAPTHPLRLLWHLQRAQLAQDWLKHAKTADSTVEALTSAARLYLRRGMVPFNLPPIIRPGHDSYPAGISKFYVEQGPLTLFWSLYIREDVADSRTFRARTQRALGITRQSVAPEEVGTIQPDLLTQKIVRYLAQHPYIYALKMNVLNPGDAGLIVDALLGVERARNKAGLPAIRYELRLFTQDSELDEVGEAVDELLNPERQVSPEADAFTVPGQNHLFPKLRFSRNRLEDFVDHPERYEAHISILHDLFPVDVELESLRSGRSSFVHGLLQEQVTLFTGDLPHYAWQRQLIPTPCLELDTGSEESDKLANILNQMAALQASIVAGKIVENVIPTLCLALDIQNRRLLYQVHAFSDWVFIIDRHLGLEYFDSDTGDDRTLYLLDFTPEFAGTDSDRLLLTTRAVEEVTRLIRPVLEERDLLLGDGVELYVLQLLRSLSGRLALKLVSSPNEVSEALGLAMGRLFLEQYNLLNDCIVLPLDAHLSLFASQPDEEMEHSLRRGDLLLVTVQPETRNLHFHLIEVKWRTDLGDFNAYLSLRQEIEHQLQDTDSTLRRHYDPHLRPVDRIDRQVKTKELMSLLTFYLARSRRYGLVDENAVQHLRAFIETLDEGYSLSTTSIGLIFDLSYDDISHEEEHAGLVYHRIGRAYINRLLEKGLSRRDQLKAQAEEKPVSIEENEQIREKRQSIVRDTSMRDDKSYQRVRSNFRVSSQKATSEVQKSVDDGEVEAEILETEADAPGETPVAPEPKLHTNEAPEIKQDDVGLIAESSEPIPPVHESGEAQPNRSSDPSIALDGTQEELATAQEIPSCDIILGDTKFSSQFGVLGKAADRVVGLDLNGTNTISLFGVQGGGKSYTVGSVVEMATKAFPKLNILPSSLATVIFHYHESQDYRPEFVSMTAPNSVEAEVEHLHQEYGIQPGRLEDVLILTSPGKVSERQAEFPGVQIEPLFFASDELSFKDWRFLMGAVGNQMYMKQINMIMRDLRHELTLDALRGEIEDLDLSKAQKRTARVRLDIAGQFIRDSRLELDPTTGFTETKRRLSDWLKPGRLIIVDLRDEFIDKDEALGLFVVMLNIFANAGREAEQSFNKLIVFDEAHKYMDNPELTGHIVDVIRQMRHQGVSVLIASQDPPSLPNAIIELSSVVILHRFNSPLWLKHVQRSITALADLTPAQMAALRPGEGYVWANKATERIFTQKAVKVQFRPRVTQHGGGTKEAV